ncbi:hypothetical protein L9F63_025693 [Diploptera punctata]|uniref:Major facilitator superfamily (MFS) profile domain-containing protein n=1 Tax=Diploptera punctata TaxID=6984 RepID=A0AAD7Z7T1_DIPPU|nr:hypothetical protein L9F63_025693 [Diploptera punctata]
MFVIYLMGTLIDWRTTATISCGVPIVASLLTLLLPETPQYLLSKGRIKDAEKSLCWLRGWVKPSHVQEELDQLILHHEESNRINSLHRGKPKETKSSGVPTQEQNLLLNQVSEVGQESVFKRTMNNFLELFKPHTLRPLVLIIPYFISSNLTGITSIRPYMIHVFTEFKQAVDPKWETVLISISGVVGSILLIFTVRFVGKRRMSLIFTAVSAAMSLSLGTYAFFLTDKSPESWIPVIFFIVLDFSTTIIGQLPWMFVSEIFPFRTRGLATAVSSAILHVSIFCVNNIYLDMEKTIGLHGSFWAFSSVNFLILIYLYYALLETEGKTLHDIERHFQRGLFFK